MLYHWPKWWRGLSWFYSTSSNARNPDPQPPLGSASALCHCRQWEACLHRHWHHHPQVLWGSGPCWGMFSPGIHRALLAWAGCVGSDVEWTIDHQSMLTLLCPHSVTPDSPPPSSFPLWQKEWSRRHSSLTLKGLLKIFWFTINLFQHLREQVLKLKIRQEFLHLFNFSWFLLSFFLTWGNENRMI